MSFMMAAAAAGGAMQMAGSYMEGKAQAGAQRNEAKQFKQAAERQRIAAIQEEARARDEVMRMTSTNVVDAAGRGQDAFSGTTGGLIEHAQQMGEKQVVQQARVSELAAQKLDYQAAVKKAQAKQTMTSTYLKMGSQLASTGGKMFGAS